MKIKIGSSVYDVIPSKVKNKKYDVYKDGSKVVSFGDKRYQQYKDKIGHYSHLDHHDDKRRKNFRNRFSSHSFSKNSANFWSYNYLW